MTLLIKFLPLLVSIAALRAEISCDDIAAVPVEEVDDFPIEKLPAFKGFAVQINKIPYSSMAYKTWRSRSREWIPNEAFLWHFYSYEQMVQAAGFVALKKAAPDLKLGTKFKYTDIAKDFLDDIPKENLKTAIIMRRERVEKDAKAWMRPYSNLKEAIRARKIDFEIVGDEHFPNQIYSERYVVTSEGRIYHTPEKSFLGAWIPVQHAELCALVSMYENAKEPIELIDMGYVSRPTPDHVVIDSHFYSRFKGRGFDLSRYMKLAFPKSLQYVKVIGTN